MGLQKNDDVCMRKPPLLKLNGIEVASHVTESAILDLLDKGVKLCMEDTYHQVRAIRSSLVVKQVIGDFRPLGIGRHGNEEITATKVPVDGKGILTMLLHVSGATNKGGRKNDPLSQLPHVNVSIGGHSICQAIVNISSELVLTGFKLIEALLLSDCPGFTDILLEKIAREKEMDGINVMGANVEAIAKVLVQADIFSAVVCLWWHVLQQVVRNLTKPTKLASWKEKNIAQRGVKRMIISNSLKGTMLPVENNVLGVGRAVTISWQNDGNLLDSSIRSQIATPVTVFLKAQGYAALLLQRHICSQLKGLLIKLSCRMQGV
jgi:hypothetical protein